MPARGVGLETTVTVFPARLTIRTAGAFPIVYWPSILTAIVAVQAWPAFGATGAPIMLTLRSLARAAGAQASAATPSTTMSFRIQPPSVAATTPAGALGFRGRSAAARAVRAAAEHRDATPVEGDQRRGRVVRVGTLPQHAVRVRAMDEHVAAGPEAGHVDRLSLLPRDVVVAESGRDPFPDRLRVGPSAKALGPPDRRPVQRPRLVRVSEAEAGLAVAADERAVRPAELVAFEPGEVPVLVGLGADVSQPHRQREAAAPDDLPRPHRAPRATAGDDERAAPDVVDGGAEDEQVPAGAGDDRDRKRRRLV